jgi:site-specific DNA recombinase
MNTMSNIKYFIYARRSSESEDKQMASIQDQVSEMQTMAKDLGLNVIEVISESKSAKEPGRKMFNEMLDRIHKGEATGIICWKLNRLARNPVDGGSISWMLQTKALQHIQTYGRDYKPEDNVLMMQVELGMANQYVKDLSMDSMRGTRKKAERGWYPSAHLPMGYKHDKEFSMGEDEIIRDGQFEIIKNLWRKIISEGYSVSDIYREAKDLGIVNRNKKHYSLNTYYALFSNPFYYGTFEWKDGAGNKITYKGNHEAMISEADFNYVQRLLGKRGRPTRINSYDFTYRGYMDCGECGCSITAERKEQCICTHCKNKFSIKNRTDCTQCGTDMSDMSQPSIIDRTYYRCTKRKKDIKCSQGSMSPSLLEKEIIKELSKINISEDFYKWSVQAIKYLNEEENVEQIKIQTSLKKKETELLTRIKNYVRMRADNEINQEDFNEARLETKKDLETIQGKISNLHIQATDWAEIANNYLNYAHNIVPRFKKADDEGKKHILSTIGSNLTLKDKSLYFSIPKALFGIKKAELASERVLPWLEPKKALINKGFLGEIDEQFQVRLPR